MPDQSAGSNYRLALLVALALAFTTASGVAEENAIVKPRDGAWVQGGVLEVIAKSPDGQLLLDGEPLSADQPFPGVLHARVEIEPGRHMVRLASSEGHAEVIVHTGNAPAGDAVDPFVDHPPIQTECTLCHSISRRGRFRFSGGCQNCHAEQSFIETHSHQPHELASCGMCHDAHGSSAANLLLLSKEAACKQCHN